MCFLRSLAVTRGKGSVHPVSRMYGGHLSVRLDIVQIPHGYRTIYRTDTVERLQSPNNNRINKVAAVGGWPRGWIPGAARNAA